MSKTIFEVCIFVLATYGFVTLIHEIILSIKNRFRYNSSMIKLVLIVKNQGDVIEGVLRNVLPRIFIRKLMPAGKLIVLDMGSKDDTVDILKKLERDYEGVEVLKRSERETIFKSFEEE
ncbi:UNVERIFIED_CONTAM: glycosyl transferase family 2 [Acetivibrio alkalicellulosi]